MITNYGLMKILIDKHLELGVQRRPKERFEKIADRVSTAFLIKKEDGKRSLYQILRI
jgi:hypothetical protein